jgi:hypothetical protein
VDGLLMILGIRLPGRTTCRRDGPLKFLLSHFLPHRPRRLRRSRSRLDRVRRAERVRARLLRRLTARRKDMQRGVLISPTLGQPGITVFRAGLPLPEGPCRVRRPEGRDRVGPKGLAHPRPVRPQEQASPEGLDRRLPVVRKERRLEGLRLREAETMAAQVGRAPRNSLSTGLPRRRVARVRAPVRRIRQCTKQPQTLERSPKPPGPLPVRVPDRRVLVSLGGTGKPLPPSQPVKASSISMTMI